MTLLARCDGNLQVDHSSRVIAIYNGTSGGTRNTIDYARKQGCQVIL